MRKKGWDRIFQSLFIGCMMLAGWAFIQVSLPFISDELKAEEQSMNFKNNAVLSIPAVPIIDADAPNAYETASFGMG